MLGSKLVSMKVRRMKKLIAVGLTAALALILGAALPASAALTKFQGFYCQIDLADAGIMRPNVEPLQTTTDSVKVCTGDRFRTITLGCTKRIEGWSGGAVAKSRIRCEVNGAQCGEEGFLNNPRLSTLAISRTGLAVLVCHFRPR